MQPEDTEEERPKGVEHLGKEVPPQARVWGEVWKLERSEVY
jgi:hypothetical protein